MAALTATQLGPDWTVPNGQYKIVTYSVSATNAAATDEWIATGGEEVLCVVGCSVIGTVPLTTTPVFVKNANGTGVTAGANPGNLGVEFTDATDITVDLTVMFR
jgi:hypothetical protein